MSSTERMRTVSGRQQLQDAPEDESVLVAQWRRRIGSTEVLCQAGVTIDKTWTFKVWLAPLPAGDNLPEPDLVFPTLLKDRQHAQRLMEMSLVDEISARAGLPRPFLDGMKMESDDAATEAPSQPGRRARPGPAVSAADR